MFDDENPFSMQIGGGVGVAPKNKPFNEPGGGFKFENSGSGAVTDNKYQILNMFWLINNKVLEQKQLAPNEVHFMSISFNIGFGNIRLEFFNMNDESIVGNMICLNKLKRLASGTVYPVAMFQLISNQPEVFCFEQIINYTNADWQNKLKPLKFQHTENGIMAILEDMCFEFTGYQKDVLLYCCKFGLNQGFQLTGENIIKRV